MEALRKVWLSSFFTHWLRFFLSFCLWPPLFGIEGEEKLFHSNFHRLLACCWLWWGDQQESSLLIQRLFPFSFPLISPVHLVRSFVFHNNKKSSFCKSKVWKQDGWWCWGQKSTCITLLSEGSALMPRVLSLLTPFFLQSPAQNNPTRKTFTIPLFLGE